MTRVLPAAWRVAALALAVGACATPAPEAPPVAADAPAAPASAEPRPADPAKKPAYVLKRGGAYYQDDGPGENPPDNLDQVPDAAPRLEPLHRFANRPYAALGRDYVPERELKPYRRVGLASWYGRKFHGARTSSGEPYDMYAMTAAHPTLPIPSYARVTNLENGRSVVVRVNDRGPFHAGRLIDLSYTAAYRLGYVDRGSARVEVESILPEGAATAYAGVAPAAPQALPLVAARDPEPDAPPTRSDAADPIAAFAGGDEPAAAIPAVAGRRGVYLQLGAFDDRDNAESFGAHLRRQIAWAAERLALVAQDGRFKLHLGPYASTREAAEVARRLAETLGSKPFVISR